MFAPADAGSADNILDEAIARLQAGTDAAMAAVNHASETFAKIKAAAEAANQFAVFGLLPLCLALLILHENARAVTEGGSFRTSYVLGRTAIVCGLVFAYGDLCHLITGLASWGGHFMTGGQYESMTDWDKSKEALSSAWDNSSIGDYIVIVLVWMMVMACALFAYIANSLLGLSQAVLITILLSLGKLCIVVSLVPGVHVGKGWARSLGQVAAWSTVGGVITALLAARNTSMRELIAAGHLAPMLKLAAQFAILAVCTLAVPAITARIFSGAAPHAVGALGTVMLGVAGLKMMSSSGFAAFRGKSSGKTEIGGGGKPPAGRTHKVARGAADSGPGYVSQVRSASVRSYEPPAQTGPSRIPEPLPPLRGPLQVAGAKEPEKPRLFIRQSMTGMRASRLPQLPTQPPPLAKQEGAEVSQEEGA
jgi:hypothetical protein